MVTVRKQIVSGAAAVSPGTNGRQYITVHQTGNTSAGANAAAHANLQSSGNSRAASWHYTVDDKEAVQSFAHTVRCWHAGDGTGPGNYSSIAVEHCVNSDGDYLQTLRNGAALVARIAEEEGIPTSRIVQHNKWSGKNCPTQIRAGQGGVTWAEYLAMVDRARKPQTPKEWFAMATEADLKKVIDAALRDGYVQRVAEYHPYVEDATKAISHKEAHRRELILLRRIEERLKEQEAAVEKTVAAAVAKALKDLKITLSTKES